MAFRTIIFEDQSGVGAVLSRLLKHRGHEVYAFTHKSQTALLSYHECGSTPPHRCADFLITDISLPGVNGLVWIEKQLAQGCCIPRIAIMSADFVPSARKRAKELGVHVFEMPFKLSEVHQWLSIGERSLMGEGAAKYNDWWLSDFSRGHEGEGGRCTEHRLSPRL